MKVPRRNSKLRNYFLDCFENLIQSLLARYETLFAHLIAFMNQYLSRNTYIYVMKIYIQLGLS
jgi:hypothetical protein